jgi:uncharacterized repeat protein (TIGR01451 family)
MAALGGALFIQNTANVNDDGDPLVTNNALIPIEFAQVEVQKSTSTPTIGLGGTATWSIQVDSTGFTTATGVTVSDVLPAGFTYTGGATATLDGVATTAPTNLGTAATPIFGTYTLPVGSTLVITFSATANASVLPGTYNNPATADTTNTTENIIPYDETSSTAEDVTVVAPELAITKANNVGGTVQLGNSWTWTLTINNSGNGDAPFPTGSVILTDTLPGSGVTYIPSVSAVTPVNVTNAVNIGCSITTNVLTCTASTNDVIIGAGGSFDVLITATPSVAGTFTNASATCSVDPNDIVNEPNDVNLCNEDSVIVTAQADLSITKTIIVTPTAIGDPIQYQVVITNNGPDTATNVVVTDNIPASIINVIVTPGATSINGTVTTWVSPNWTISSLDSGETATLTLDGFVNASGTISNSAEVTASDQTDPNSTPNNNEPTEDDQDNADVIIAAQADLSLA